MNETLLLAATALILGLPLLGFIINALLIKRTSADYTGHLATAMVAIPFLISLFLFFSLNGTPTDVHLAPWFEVGAWKVDFSFRLDQLSLAMLLIITGVGTLIHVYSISYMHHDEYLSKYFSYLNLFVFFMLMLVMGDSLFLMFIGWEGVGLASYLLIGFWFKNPAYNDAAKKAFIMNRIGDVGFLLGMFLVLQNFGTLNFQAIVAGSLPDTFTLTAITLLLFFAATGKSAQIPLYTWLPDAMAGPTPVSALIHAATMVTAGIYMILRLSPLFAAAEFTLDVILFIGTATCLFGAVVGVKQNDIKKVLAYSTVSQLGIMFAALGAGAFTGAFFHLTTHAFFKALLFLGAGSVIHALGGEQDIRRMGGLKGKIPVTFVLFMIGSLAISGIPPFAGFFSKDEILAHAFMASPVAWFFLQLGSLLTAFYMFRLVFLVFYGEFRGSDHTAAHIHESPLMITFPLGVLAVLSAVGGFMGVPEIFFHAKHVLGDFLAPVFERAEVLKPDHGNISHALEWILMGLATSAAVGAILYARHLYVTKGVVPEGDEVKQSLFNRLVIHKFYVDEIYDNVVRKPIDSLSSVMYSFIEKSGLDGVVNSLGSITVWSGEALRKVQNGSTGFYIFAMVIGLIVLFILQFVSGL